MISKDNIAKTFANREELPHHQERVGNSSKGLSKVFVIRVIWFISMYRKQAGWKYVSHFLLPIVYLTLNPPPQPPVDRWLSFRLEKVFTHYVLSPLLLCLKYTVWSTQFVKEKVKFKIVFASQTALIYPINQSGLISNNCMFILCK